MSDFRFDDSKSFAENCKSFLEALESRDPEMAKILSDNWEDLINVVCDGTRDARARSEFNNKVVSALDDLLQNPN